MKPVAPPPNLPPVFAPPQAAGRTARTLDDCWNKIGVRGDKSCPELAKVAHCRNCPVYAAAAVRLLDAEIPEARRAEWTRRLAVPEAKESSGFRSAVVFRLGREWLSLSTSRLKEISEIRRTHSIPHRGGKLALSLANIRGELLVCVPLRDFLGIEPPTEGGTRAGLGRMLVARSAGEQPLVFPVDEVDGVHRHPEDEILAVPTTLSKSPGTYSTGVFRLNGKTVGWLDEELLFYTLNRSLG